MKDRCNLKDPRIAYFPAMERDEDKSQGVNSIAGLARLQEALCPR